MAGTARQIASARRNGHLGGRPTNALTELKRKSREKATKLLCAETEESIKFLVFVRDDANVAIEQRIRCALELLTRGEAPPKSANYLGAAGAAGELLEEPPKLVVLGRFDQERKNGAQENGHEPGGNGGAA